MRILTSLCVLLAIIYWLYRLSRAIYNLFSYFNIRAFYAQALDIKPVREEGDFILWQFVSDYFFFV